MSYSRRQSRALPLLLNLLTGLALNTMPAMTRAEPLVARQIPTAATAVLFCDFDAIRNNRLGEMLRDSAAFQQEFARRPIGDRSIHGPIHSVLGVMTADGTVGVLVNVRGSAATWFDNLAKGTRSQDGGDGLRHFSDSNRLGGRVVGQLGRFRKNGEIYVAVGNQQVLFAGSRALAMAWRTQLAEQRAADWLATTPLSDASILAVRRQGPEHDGLRDVAISAIDDEVSIRVNYRAKSEAIATVMAMLRPEVVSKMLTAMQAQNEASQQKSQQKAKQQQNGKTAKPPAAAEDIAAATADSDGGNSLKFGLGFRGENGLSECAEFLRSTMRVQRDGLDVTVQWQGLLEMEFSHTTGSTHVYSLQFQADPSRQVELARRKSALK